MEENRILVEGNKLYKAVPPQTLFCPVARGYVMNIYDARSRTAYMFSSSSTETPDLTEILSPVRKDFSNTSSLAVYVLGNIFPEDLEAAITKAINPGRISIMQLAEETIFNLGFDPATATYDPQLNLSPKIVERPKPKIIWN